MSTAGGLLQGNEFRLCRAAGSAYIAAVQDPFPKPIDAGTRYCAVFGHPVGHSASPAMQNAGMAALGLNWRYLAFDVVPTHLRSALDGARVMRFVGLNLTVPHKLMAMDLVDVLDESAQSWGAVNTIRFEAQDATGRWVPVWQTDDEGSPIRAHGFNTDADAIGRALRKDLGIECSGARAVVLGAGGAGRVAALKLAADGARELFLVNRTQEKAEAVAAEIRRRYNSCRVGLGYPVGTVDVVLNATSLGLRRGDALPVDLGRLDLRRVGAVFDMIYRPAETPLLAAARAAGCRTANGLGMLLYQGARALELWTGRPAPESVMRQALTEHVHGS